MHDGEAIEIRPYRPGEAGYVSYIQMDFYHRAFGFRPVFERYLLEGLAKFIENPEGSRLWVALDGGRIIGSVAICRTDAHTAQLRWFFIDEHYRGQGLGKRMLDTAMAFCAENGYADVFLWTADLLKSARHLYGKYGFRHVEDEPNYDWTGEKVTEERWELHRDGAGEA
jgi:GNAT superfamily N-acetyltransferase